jgi:hypothetical protein
MNYNPCKFHGKFSDLIPAGFKFQKLHLNNYNQYCYDITINDKIRVWQANGGTVEVLGMSTTATRNLYAFIKKHGVEKFKYSIKPNIAFPTGSEYYKWVVNNHTQEIEMYDIEYHDAIYAGYTMKEKEYDESYIDLAITNMYETYSTKVYGYKQMDAIMMMIDKGFVIP